MRDLSGKSTITVPEAGEYLGIGRDAAYAAAKRGEIPTLRIGRRLIVPVPALLSMLGTPESDGVAPPDPIREAVMRVVAAAPPMTAEHLTKIVALLHPYAHEPREFIGVSMADAERIAQRQAVGQSPCKAKRWDGSGCPHPAMPGSDYCQMHGGIPPTAGVRK